MARPREFDETEALGSAMDVFRSKGYEAASLMDLLKAMDLSKSSLYNSFGTKHQLFLASIDHYVANDVKAFEERLAKADTIKQAISTTFVHSIDQITNGGNRRGCYLQICASEVLPQDRLAERHISRGVGRFQTAFTDYVKRAQASGQISKEKNAKTLGEFLTMTFMGLQCMGRVDKDQQRLETVVSQVESILS